MSKMIKKLLPYMAIGMGNTYNSFNNSKPKNINYSSEDEINRKKGLKRFDYENGYVWALNEKSAKRKISKKR